MDDGMGPRSARERKMIICAAFGGTEYIMSSNASFYFKPGEGSYIETKVSLSPDTASAVMGTVTQEGEPATGALVLLFRADDGKFVDRQFTDGEGQFLFGPLEPDVLYHAKIHKRDDTVRELEQG